MYIVRSNYKGLTCESDIECRTQFWALDYSESVLHAPNGASYILADSQVSPKGIDIPIVIFLMIFRA